MLSTLKERHTIPESIEIVNRAVPDKGPITWKGEEISTTLVPPMNCFGEDKKAFSTGLSHDETGHVDLTPDTYENLMKRLQAKIDEYSHLMPQPELYKLEDADLVVIAYGSTSRSVKQAILMARKQGMKVGLFRPKTIWPFPQNQMRNVVGDRKSLVVEMSSGQLIWPVERYLRRQVAHMPYLRGAIPPPSKILAKIKEVMN